ncbi:MAG TPA: TIGR03016 family PEP-CTERM system-associated outer membrane protein [Nitrospira sp.]|nr:TIGR03016 family PEP-CTERM system-associated outer membrane protein [Nitrospira sp.]
MDMGKGVRLDDCRGPCSTRLGSISLISARREKRRHLSVSAIATGLAVFGISAGAVAADVQGVLGRDDIENAGVAMSKSGQLLEPRISVRETWTDNISLAPSGAERSDWVTELSPGIHLRGAGGRIKYDVDYQRSEIFYAKSSSSRDRQNFLSAFGSIEAIENFFFVDINGRISQQTISALGVQPSSTTSASSNRTETRQFSIAPYVRGRMRDFAAYDLRYTAATLRSKGEARFDNDSRVLEGKISSLEDTALIGWLAEYRNEKNDYADARDSDYELGRGTISVSSSRQLRFFARAGWESTNIIPGKDSFFTHGFGLRWLPSERTQLSLESDQRYFGRAYVYSFRHRTPRTSWSLLFSRDASTTNQRLLSGAGGTIFDRLMDILGPTYSDPTQRADEARRVLSLMGATGQETSEAGFLSNQVFIDRRAEASAAWIGQRNTFTLTILRTEANPLLNLLGNDGDFGLSPAVKQEGFRLDWVHRFGPLTSLTSAFDWRKNQGTGASSQDSKLWIMNVFLNRQLGPKTSISAGARHAKSDSGGDGYRENAVLALVTHRF